MKSSWLTSLFGILAGVPILLHQTGITIGHLGSGDWLNLIQAVGVAGVGLAARDVNKSSEDSGIK